MAQLELDCKCLKDCGIMDYSLLLGVHKPTDDAKHEEGVRHSSTHITKHTLNECLLTIRGKKRSAFQQYRGGIRCFHEDGQTTDGVYFMGIIDILQEYNIQKNLKYKFTNPYMYAHTKNQFC
eukprot:TRINITY_DN2989_c0_g1_i1.p1 TRINITY_DN2989_c0_g1~~TRINITY_DN2989_c0_g1_i1.p1  ORF type:complete len:138 (-),score=25.74 TRINITY_DN2989_c0_g1_i1:83-448(-)